MFECLTKINWKKVGLFASGTLFGTDVYKRQLHYIFCNGRLPD